MHKTDISSRQDIDMLMSEFYGKLLKDPEISYFFTEIAKIDLVKHLPVLGDFWESILFGGGKYKGNVMFKHIELHKRSKLNKEHFDKWLLLFNETLDEHFAGPIAAEAKRRANIMSELMQYKTKLSENNKNIL